jgi:hypothetical protein
LLAAFFGLIAGASAQTLSPPISHTQFEGTYGFVSATKVNETYMTTSTNRIGRCGNYPRGGPLTIVGGHARYSAGGPGFEGTVGPQGELAMQFVAQPAPKGVDTGRERRLAAEYTRTERSAHAALTVAVVMI